MICEKCGQENANTAGFCSHCGAALAPAPQKPVAEIQKPENVLAGVVGAILGAAIGAVVIVVLSQLGVVAALSGIILAVCTMKGYELLAGRMSTKGMIIAVILVLVTPYIADRIDWAIVLVRDLGREGLQLSYGEAFKSVPEMVELGVIDSDTYTGNLVQLYLFTALGAVGTLFSGKKKK